MFPNEIWISAACDPKSWEPSSNFSMPPQKELIEKIQSFVNKTETAPTAGPATSEEEADTPIIVE